MVEQLTSTGLAGQSVDTLMKGQPASTAEHQKYILYKGMVESEVANADQQRFVEGYEAKGGSKFTRATGASTIETPTDTGGYGQVAAAEILNQPDLLEDPNYPGHAWGSKYLYDAGLPEDLYHQMATYDLNRGMWGQSNEDTSWLKRGARSAAGIAGIPTAMLGSPFYDMLYQGQNPGMQWWNRMKGSANYAMNELGMEPQWKDRYDYIMETSPGQEALGQAPSERAAQWEATQGRGDFAGYTPDPGNVQAPRMTSSQIAREADVTGGTRHAGEMTQAAGRVRTQPVRGPHARGGIASLWQR
jgi:hypothetical protein